MKTLTKWIFRNKFIQQDFNWQLEISSSSFVNSDARYALAENATHKLDEPCLKTARSWGKFAEILRLQFYDDVMPRVKLWLKREERCDLAEFRVITSNVRKKRRIVRSEKPTYGGGTRYRLIERRRVSASRRANPLHRIEPGENSCGKFLCSLSDVKWYRDYLSRSFDVPPRENNTCAKLRAREESTEFNRSPVRNTVIRKRIKVFSPFSLSSDNRSSAEGKWIWLTRWRPTTRTLVVCKLFPAAAYELSRITWIIPRECACRKYKINTDVLASGLRTNNKLGCVSTETLLDTISK